MSILCSPPPVSNGSRGGGARGGDGGARRDAAWTARTSGRGISSASAVVAAAATAAGLYEVGLDLGPPPLGALEATAGPSQGQGTAASFNKEPAEPLGTGGPGRRGGVGMRG